MRLLVNDLVDGLSEGTNALGAGSAGIPYKESVGSVRFTNRVPILSSHSSGVERCFYKAGVGGSNPSASTKFKVLFKKGKANERKGKDCVHNDASLGIANEIFV